MRSKVMSYLGFAAKAGKIVNGYNTCMFMMEKKKVKLEYHKDIRDIIKDIYKHV